MPGADFNIPNASLAELRKSNLGPEVEVTCSTKGPFTHLSICKGFSPAEVSVSAKGTSIIIWKFLMGTFHEKNVGFQKCVFMVHFNSNKEL